MAAILTPSPDTHDRMLRETLKSSVRALRAASAAPALPVRPESEAGAEADRQPPSPPAAEPLITEPPPADPLTANDLTANDIAIDLRVADRAPTAPLPPQQQPFGPAAVSSSFRYVAVRNVGAMYCYRCGHFSTHQLVRLTSGRSRWHHHTGGYLRQCMSCGDMDRPALDDLLSAGIPPDQWHPARPRLTVIGLVVTMVSSLVIMMAAGVAIGAALA